MAEPTWRALTSPWLGLRDVVAQPEHWGVVTNEAPSVAGDFLVLASVAGIATAASYGWALPVFLIGTAIVFKVSVGVALVAGFALVELRRSVLAKGLRPSPHVIAVAAVFAVTYSAFWVAPAVEQDFGIALHPLGHFDLMMRRGTLLGLACDILWLFLPVGVLLGTGIKDPDTRSTPLVLLAMAPLLVVNLTRMVDVRPNAVGSDDWNQLVRPVPFLIHAFALSYASRRWDRLGRGRRLAFAFTVMLVVAPVAAAAGHYAFTLIRHPQQGHEFVDNRPLAEVLQRIPTAGTLIVTNDLRCPVGSFSRENRQMQIPALFGHQAFAVNYAYETYAFSLERERLQELLRAPQWSDTIVAAARTHGWTHLVIRKDYQHPDPIPLERIVENQLYVVFRFGE